MASNKLKPKLAPPPYNLDPSITQRRLEDLQRMFGMYTFPFSLSPNPDYMYVAESPRGRWRKLRLPSISGRVSA